MAGSKLLIGVDGGGTSTVAYLAKFADGNLEPLGEGQAGPSNISGTSRDTAQANVNLAIQRAFQDATLRRTSVSAIALGMAGAGRENARQMWSDWVLCSQLAQRRLIVSDAQLILAQGAVQENGIAIISGTGSIAIAGTAHEIVARVGGWGDRFSDGGSGYAIALDGLRAAALFADQRGPDTQLLSMFMTRLGCQTPQALITRLNPDSMTHSAVAHLATVVVEAAVANDSIACRIIDNAATELAELAETLAERLKLGDPVPLAVGGGTLNHAEPLRHAFLRKLDQSKRDFQITFVPKPVLGALRLAQSLIQ